MNKIEDSLKGLWITLTLIGLFATAILGFIELFPGEQGMSYSDNLSNNAYLTVMSINNSYTSSQITAGLNSTDTAFNQWDITQGFMGSNTLKQSSQGSVGNFLTNTGAIFTLMANALFGTVSPPIVYAISIILTLAGLIVTYMVIKFVRQGS